jgi:hypothetical protein
MWAFLWQIAVSWYLSHLCCGPSDVPLVWFISMWLVNQGKKHNEIKLTIYKPDIRYRKTNPHAICPWHVKITCQWYWELLQKRHISTRYETPWPVTNTIWQSINGSVVPHSPYACNHTYHLQVWFLSQPKTLKTTAWHNLTNDAAHVHKTKSTFSATFCVLVTITTHWNSGIQKGYCTYT